jgi:hypothetical protein
MREPGRRADLGRSAADHVSGRRIPRRARVGVQGHEQVDPGPVRRVEAGPGARLLDHGPEFECQLGVARQFGGDSDPAALGVEPDGLPEGRLARGQAVEQCARTATERRRDADSGHDDPSWLARHAPHR